MRYTGDDTADLPITVILNSGSGHDDDDKNKKAIKDELAASGRKFRVLLVSGAREMESRAQEVIEQGTQQILVAAGGDGTVNAVAGAAMAGKLPFGVIPLGTFNYFARDLGIPVAPAAAVRVIAEGRVRCMHVALINGHLFLNNASFGLYQHLIEQREETTQRWGRYRIVALASGVLTLLRHHRVYEVQLELGGQNVVLRTPMIFFANNTLQLEKLDLEVAECTAEGMLALLVLRPMARLQLFGFAWRGALKGLRRAENLRCYCASKIEVHWRANRTRIKVAVDGECIECNLPLRIEVARDALAVLVPCEPEARA